MDFQLLLAAGAFALVAVLVIRSFRCPRCGASFTFRPTSVQRKTPGEPLEPSGRIAKEDQWRCRRCDHEEWKPRPERSGRRGFWGGGDAGGNGG